MQGAVNNCKIRAGLSADGIVDQFKGRQLTISFLLFILLDTVLVSSSWVLSVLRSALPDTGMYGALVSISAILAWSVIPFGLMWRLAKPPSGDRCVMLTRYLFCSFALLFRVEGIIDRPIGPLPTYQVEHLRPWIQMLSAISVTLVVSFLLSHWSRIWQGSTIEPTEHARFLAAAETTLDDFYIFDGIPDDTGQIVDFRFSYINPNAERRLNVARETLLGRVLTEVRPFMVSSGLIEDYREVVRTGVPFTTEIFLDDDMIKGTWLNIQVIKLGDGVAITSRDVTEPRRLADRINYLAHHDQLTGLANRVLLHDRLEQALLRAQRHNKKVAIFTLDIDHFKRINDSLGHVDGDALLATFGQRLLASVRETDTVARIGGDEFVVVMPEFKSVEHVRHAGAKIIESVSKPARIGGREVAITVSIGACIYPDCGHGLDELLRNADAAMYMVKNSGRNGLNVIDQESVSSSVGS